MAEYIWPISPEFVLAISESASIAGLFCGFDLAESVHNAGLLRRGSV